MNEIILDLQWALNLMTGVLRERKGEIEKRGNHVKTKVEVGVTQPQAKNACSHQSNRSRKDPPLETSEEARPCRLLISNFQPPEL